MRGRGPGFPCGEAHPFHVLTEAAVVRIRARFRDGESVAALARDVGVAHRTIEQVVSRTTWRHVAEPEGTVAA